MLNWVVLLGGVTFTKIVCGCACQTSKIWLSLYQFFVEFLTHQYTIFEKKHPISIKLGAFNNNLQKNTPNLFNLGSFSSDENARDRYTIFREKAPQKAGTYTYTMSMWETPSPG